MLNPAPKPSISSLHLRVSVVLVCALDPQNIVAPYQNLSKDARHLLINPLFCARQLDVHVTVYADQAAFVFCLSPLQTDDNFLVDQVLQHRPRIDGYETHFDGCG